MNKNQRHNRPRKKEVLPEKWDSDLEELKKRYQYGGEHHGENKNPTKE